MKRIIGFMMGILLIGLSVSAQTTVVKYNPKETHDCGYSSDQAALTASYGAVIPVGATDITRTTYTSMPCGGCLPQICYKVTYNIESINDKEGNVVQEKNLFNPKVKHNVKCGYSTYSEASDAAWCVVIPSGSTNAHTNIFYNRVCCVEGQLDTWCYDVYWTENESLNNSISMLSYNIRNLLK